MKPEQPSGIATPRRRGWPLRRKRATRMRMAVAVLIAGLAACIGVSLLFAAGAGRAAAAPAGSPWGADYFPNPVLVNQDGERRHFYDDLLKGKVVAINFIFTSCPNACPVETAKLRQVQQALGERVGKDVFMYSISIDPARDTPAVLKAYAQRFKVGPGWEFLTGRQEDIRALRKQLGLFAGDRSEQENFDDHSLSLIVGNEATGRWMKRSPFDNPRVLADLLGGALHNYKTPRAGRLSYAAAAPVDRFERGENLFRSRCAACHTLGAGDGLGPDLLGVAARRDPDWLLRWIKAPDRMLAAGDPIALALFERFAQLPMPNLGLNTVDAKAVLDYIAAATQRQAKPPP